MMRPIGLFLTEFRPSGPADLSAPAFSDLSSSPEMGDVPEPDVAKPENPDEEALGTFGVALDEAGSVDAEPVAGLEDSAGPSPDIAAVLAERDVAHAAALAEARAQWVREESAVLAERIGQAFDELETRLADALAPLLEPFLANAARAKALGQLRTTLGILLKGADPRAVTVSGPLDLIDALRDMCGDRPVAFAEASAPDVTIALGDTRIRSQLRAWARKLESALGVQA